MKYQLVMQFDEELDGGLNKLIVVEDILEENLSSIADVDGHDIGNGQMNIFIFTDSPSEVLKEILIIFTEEPKLVSAMRIAYREVVGNQFIYLWPTNLTDFKVI
jgi:hypothetical protein